MHLQLSIDYLNTKRFAPTCDEEDLKSGVLQLPEGTNVVISDAAIVEGTLNEGENTSGYPMSFWH